MDDADLKLGASVTMNDAPKSDGTSVGVTLTEINATYSKNNIYARLENGTILLYCITHHVN